MKQERRDRRMQRTDRMEKAPQNGYQTEESNSPVR